MSKLYYKNSNNSSAFSNIYSNILNHFISSCDASMPLPFLKFLPSFVLGLLSSESVIFDDLASILAPIYNINFDSASKHIKRFLSNPLYDFNFFYEKFISFILSTYKIKHSDKNVCIAFDHMYTENRFSTLMFTLRIGNSGIPLWFRSFDYHSKDAFQFELFKEGISFCHNLIKSIDPDASIDWVADRWFGNHYKILHFIEDLKDNFYFRTKGDTVTLVYDKKEGHFIYKPIHELTSYKYHSTFYNNILISKKHYSFNLTISKEDSHKEPFYIITNGDPKNAVKIYNKRFSSIEFLFKAQKSNGLFLEETQLKDLYTFNSLYVCICIAQTLATILGIDYSKNSKCYKEYKIKTTKLVNGIRKRVFSYFHVGLILIKHTFFSITPFPIFKRLILYDV